MDRIDEAVEVALLKMPVDVWNADGADYMRAALLAGVKVLLGPVVAYEVVTPTDDPDVLDARLWAAAPGMTIPDGAIKLYAPSLGEGDGR